MWQAHFYVEKPFQQVYHGMINLAKLAAAFAFLMRQSSCRKVTSKTQFKQFPLASGYGSTASFSLGYQRTMKCRTVGSLWISL